MRQGAKNATALAVALCFSFMAKVVPAQIAETLVLSNENQNASEHRPHLDPRVDPWVLQKQRSYLDPRVDPWVPKNTLPPPLPTLEELPLSQGSGAVLRVLDKVAAYTVEVILPNHSFDDFGNLNIRLDECRYLAFDPTANAYAHVTLTDPQKPKSDFSGWMIASSPALSAFDHPRYDVWII
ncbi:MAG: DUF2155 domain-containing protein, partial [Paracoccaceae bacterium]